MAGPRNFCRCGRSHVLSPAPSSTRVGDMTANLLLTRRSFLAVPAAALFAQRISRSAAAVAAMKDAYRNVFLIGTALDFRRPDEFTSEELELITSQFNA